MFAIHVYLCFVCIWVLFICQHPCHLCDFLAHQWKSNANYNIIKDRRKYTKTLAKTGIPGCFQCFLLSWYVMVAYHGFIAFMEQVDGYLNSRKISRLFCVLEVLFLIFQDGWWLIQRIFLPI